MADRSVPATRAESTNLASQIIGFRIMRENEIAPGWWGAAREVGDTRSGTVADTFCTEQNKVTMDRNRAKRIMYYADPIYSTATVAAWQADHDSHTLASEGAARGQLTFTRTHAGGDA